MSHPPAEALGRPAWGAAFPTIDGDALDATLRALLERHPSPAVPVLIEQLVVGQWQAARSAIAALRREGPAGAVAAPTVTAWLRGSLATEGVSRHSYALREAVQALRGWWPQVEADDDAEPLRRFYVDRVEPTVIELLQGEAHALHRGAIDYLREAAVDLPRALAALRSFLSQPASPDGDGYARAAAITALQSLSGRLAPAPVSDAPAPVSDAPAPVSDGPSATTEGGPQSAAPALTASFPETDQPIDPLAGDVEGFVDRLLVPLLVAEFETGPPSARAAALGALRQLGERAEVASAAMWRLIRQGPFEEAELERLRQRALQAFVPLVGRKLGQVSPGPASADPERADTARTVLIELAMGDRDPRVRAESLEALCRLGDDDPEVWAAAVESTNSEVPVIRVAAARLIALLGALARRSKAGRPG